MQLYNTLTRTLEDFKPLSDKKITFYQCGPTVYWIQHIGNLRAMTWADLIRRSMLFLGYDVVFARNYTDVGHLTSDEDEGEDKMEKGAKREGKTPQEIADKYIRIFEDDTRALNILEPTYKPRATEYIRQMIEMVQKLLDTGHAYITEYAVYFDVSTFKDYNRLNRQNMESNQKGLGKGTAEDTGKKHFADFALWFFKKGAHKNALQTWPSPWGEGFPGWHIECSVMSKSLLGDTIDVHMGGVEHVAVHHTNEIAQSESANGVKFVNYWLHNEHLNVDNAKMAKSQGTGFTLQEIRDKGFDPLDLRYFFLQAHYRSKQNFTWEALEAAKQGRSNLYTLYGTDASETTVKSELGKEYENKFKELISKDFQISQALALAWTMLKDEKLPKAERKTIFDEFDRVFGLDFSKVPVSVIPEEVIRLAEERKQAKEKKDFAHSDQLRKEIESRGFVVEDTKDGFKIRKK